eukprot:GCRY01002763.1.p1 GENE.GCRY01002763.1~~GCRY01002763.1.p1  ORF type:complete len:159 (+),score=33.68 GCRY01002763.1:411-887(+)
MTALQERKERENDVENPEEAGNPEDVIDVDISVFSLPDDDGYTPLHFAVASNNAEDVQFLLEIGVDIEAVNKEGKRPLHLAALLADVNVVKMLLDAGAVIEAADHVGFKVLELLNHHTPISFSLALFPPHPFPPFFIVFCALFCFLHLSSTNKSELLL